MDELDNIRRESVRKIFSLVCERDGLSRAEIAKQSGISLMTVGKIIAALEQRGLIEQRKQKLGKAGRRASCVFVNRDICFVLINVEKGICRAYHADLGLNAVEFENCRSMRDGNEVPTQFFDTVKKCIQSLPPEKYCAGIGLVFPFDSENSEDVAFRNKLNEEAERTFSDKLYVFDPIVAAATAEALSNENSLTGRELYIWLGDGIGAAYSENKRIIHASNMLGYISYNGMPTYLSLNLPIYERISAYIQAIHSCLMTLIPNSVVVAGSFMTDCDVDLDRIKNGLLKMPLPPHYTLPDFRIAEHNSVYGAGLIMRDEFLRKMKI